MSEKLNSTVVRYGRSFVEWLNNHSFKMVFVLSLLHIGLAYIHAQRSSRADCQLFPECAHSILFGSLICWPSIGIVVLNNTPEASPARAG
jgi:hypothetical protein